MSQLYGLGRGEGGVKKKYHVKRFGEGRGGGSGVDIPPKKKRLT